MSIKNTFLATLSVILLAACGGGGGGGGDSVTPNPTPAPTPSPTPSPTYDASIFVPEGQTKSFQGYIFNKEVPFYGCLASVEFELINNNNFLEINSYLVDEARLVGYDYDEDNQVYTSGLRIKENFVLTEDGERTVYEIPLTDSTTNGISIAENSTNPYNFEGSLDDLEQFYGDIFLETTTPYYCYPSLEMGLVALPESSQGADDSILLGTSQNSEGYTFMYLHSKDYWESNLENNLPTESDLFGVSFATIEAFTSYRSAPNLVADDYGFRVKSDLVEEANNGSYIVEKTIEGSRLTDQTTASDNEVYWTDDYVTKYLYEGNDTWSNQRPFLKLDISYDCLRSYSQFRECNTGGWEILFLAPDKEGLIGFRLGGYNEVEDTTNAVIHLNNEG